MRTLSRRTHRVHVRREARADAQAAPPRAGTRGQRRAAPAPATACSRRRPKAQDAGRPPAVRAVEPQGYTYNPEGRRDPFVSLVRAGTRRRGTTPGARPAGLGGPRQRRSHAARTCSRAEDGFVGDPPGRRHRTYIVRAGDRLLDGTVRPSTAERDGDPAAGQRPALAREAARGAKVLRQTDEAK